MCEACLRDKQDAVCGIHLQADVNTSKYKTFSDVRQGGKIKVGECRVQQSEE